MSRPRPPRMLEGLLERALPAGLSGQGTLGDLAEEFERRARRSPLRARLWYAGQAASLLTWQAWRGEPSSRDGSDLAMDLRWSLRAIARHPGFALGVVAVLGLGLGATVAVFAVVDGTLRGNSAWQAPDRTVAIWPGSGFSQGQINLYGQEQSAYRSLGGYLELAFSLESADGESQSVKGVFITPELFRELAAQPSLGRSLADEDGLIGTEAVAVLGQDLWQRTFGGDPEVVGSRVQISGAPYTVVGIQGAGAGAPGGRAELWLPLVPDPRDDDYWKAQSYSLVGVLRDGASIDDAQADLMGFTELLSSMFPMFYPVDYAKGIAFVDLADRTQRDMIATPLLLLLSGTALLMLVTALNVGNLLLGRGIERRRELAVRSALGAGRGRIVRQLLAEGLVLTGVALAVALATAAWGSDWVASLFVEQAVVQASPVLSPAVLGFAMALAGLAWLVLNGVPVAHFLRSARSGLTVSPDSGARTRRTLVTAQAALATLLLVSATLLVVTVDNLRQVPLGFDPGNLLTVELSPPADRVASPAAARELYDRLVARVSALPGVDAAGLTGWLPLRAQAPPTPINPEAAPIDPREAIRAPMHMVDPGFFQALGLAPTSGRLLGTLDRDDLPTAVVVNESLAARLWPDGNAVGQRIAIDPHDWQRWVPVVGVIPDVRSGAIRGPTGPALYVALAEMPARDVTVVVRRSGGSPADLASLVRRAVAEVDPLVPVRSVAPMSDVVRAAYATSWVMMGLLIVLAGLATALGAVGIYAVLTQHVTLSRREIGVRMALGAQPRALVGSVIRSGMVLCGVGIVAGSVVAALSTRFLESLLYEVSALSPWAFVAPAAALGVAALVAAWVPAARAGNTPPAEVLRSD